MKISSWILLCCLFLASCATEIPEESRKNMQPEEQRAIEGFQVHPSVKTCGIITCALQEYLEKQEQAGKLNLNKSKYFQTRFWSLVERHREKDALMKAEEFQKFVKDFHTEYFAEKSAHTYDEKNFIWYIFLPRMVDEEFARKVGWDEQDADSIVQSIKEKYYATYDEKEAVIQVYKDKLTKKVKKIDISSVDKKRLQEDAAYFEQMILTPGLGLYDKVFQDITSIIYPERWQLRDLTFFTTDTFFSKIEELWITKEYFYNFIGTSDKNFRKLDSKIEAMDQLYGLSQKIPSDRYLRNDEVVNYIFTNLWEFNTKWNFNKDTLELRHYILLQYSFPDEKLYSMPERVSKFNSVNNFMAEDIYKYSKSVNDVTVF